MPYDWKGPYSRKLAKRASERGRRMANARWKRFRETAHLRPEPEPKFVRYFPLELGIRDKRTKEEAWIDLCSVRDAMRRLSVVLKFYV